MPPPTTSPPSASPPSAPPPSAPPPSAPPPSAPALTKAPPTTTPLAPDAAALLADAYRSHAPTVHAYLARRSSCHVADDLTAVVFETAGRNLERGDTAHLTPAWLLTVAKRRLIDHWRFEARAEPDSGIGWEGWVDRNDVAVSVDVERLLAGLPDRERTCLELRYLLGHSVTAVAERLSISYSAAESALHRARLAARATMGAGYLAA